MASTSQSATRPSETNSRPGVSLIWNFFERLENDAKCVACKKVLKTPCKLTSALIRHLENKHKPLIKQFQNKQKKVAKAKEA